MTGQGVNCRFDWPPIQRRFRLAKWKFLPAADVFTLPVGGDSRPARSGRRVWVISEPPAGCRKGCAEKIVEITERDRQRPHALRWRFSRRDAYAPIGQGGRPRWDSVADGGRDTAFQFRKRSDRSRRHGGARAESKYRGLSAFLAILSAQL